MSVLAILLLLIIPFGWAAMNRRYDEAQARHNVQIAYLSGRVRDITTGVLEMAQEIAEMRGALNLKRAKRGS